MGTTAIKAIKNEVALVQIANLYDDDIDGLNAGFTISETPAVEPEGWTGVRADNGTLTGTTACRAMLAANIRSLRENNGPSIGDETGTTGEWILGTPGRCDWHIEKDEDGECLLGEDYRPGVCDMEA